VNTELLRLYWDMGQDIVARQMATTWGSGFFEQLSKDLRSEFLDMQGFSVVNLTYCKRFYLFYARNNTIRHKVVGEFPHQLGAELQTTDNEGNVILQQLVEELEDHSIFQIPWGHHIQIFTKCKSVKEALFYVQKTIENGWSRAVLMNFMEADLFSAQGKALTNFSRLLLEPQSDLAVTFTETYGKDWTFHKSQHGVRSAYTFSENVIVYAVRTQFVCINGNGGLR
jgi:predicted nuclease of restriction endonuclease-like (RecB) superfamily